MRNLHTIICLTSLLAGLGLQTAAAKDAPASAGQLRNEFEAALKAKDTNSLMGLFQWRGVSDPMKAEMGGIVTALPKHDWIAVKLAPLPADVQATNELNGIRYRPSVPVIGWIEVDFAQAGNSLQLPYGKSGDAYYLSGTVEEKMPGTFPKAKALSIRVLGTEDVKFISGSCVFVQSGKEIKKTINERGTSFLGDYIKSCTVQKTTDDGGTIQLAIEEDGQRIFESPEITNTTPVVFEKQ